MMQSPLCMVDRKEVVSGNEEENSVPENAGNEPFLGQSGAISVAMSAALHAPG